MTAPAHGNTHGNTHGDPMARRVAARGSAATGLENGTTAAGVVPGRGSAAFDRRRRTTGLAPWQRPPRGLPPGRVTTPAA